jgi:hypothetical protein
VIVGAAEAADVLSAAEAVDLEEAALRRSILAGEPILR